jgi:hypothetical protein
MSAVRLLPAWLHAVADYAVGIGLIVIALLVGGATKAVLPGVVVGAVVLLVSLITKYPLGLIKVLPFTVHSAGDYLAAALLLASPFALGFWSSARGLSIVYLVAGVAVLGVSLITNYQWSPKRQSASRPVSDRSERSDRSDARQWYTAAAGARTQPAPAPAYEEPTYAAAGRPSYAPQGAAPAAPERAVSLRDAIAASRLAS